MSTAATPRPPLFGREAELGRIDAVLTGVASTGSALLIVGAPGVGKTALLDTAAAEAADRGMAVLRATAIQAETLLPFASLHQLLRPLASRVRRLAPRQRDVIRAAFGEVEGVGRNAFLVAMATLNLLTDAAANAPLLLAVDDAQWSDAPSVQVLAFVARRLRDTPVLLAVGLREGYPSALHDAGLPTLIVPELDEAASEQGVLALPLSALRATLPVLRNPANRHRAISLTADQFRYGFGNAVPHEESDALYERWTIPAPGKPLFEAATAAFHAGSPSAVNTANAERGPLLLIGGGKDHTVPTAVTRSTLKQYEGSGAVTDLVEFPDRGHSLTIDHGWSELADATLAWLDKNGLGPR